MRPLLKLEDVASLLNVSVKTVNRWASVNPEKLPPRTILPGTRIWRCRPEDLDRWLNEANGISPDEPVEPEAPHHVKKTDYEVPVQPERITPQEFFRKRRNRG